MKLIMENWRGYLNEEASNAALDYLENAFKNEHASGRPFTKLFDESKLNEEEMPSEALEIVNSITPKYIAEVLEKYKSVGFKGSIGMDEVSDPREIAVINSIMLFTAGNVASVRDPEDFKADAAGELEAPEVVSYASKKLAAVPKYYKGKISKPDPERAGSRLSPEEFDYTYPAQLQGSAIPYIIKPTKVMYTIARYVMIQMGNMKNPEGSTRIYRGISLPPKVILALKSGMEFNTGRIASWTTEIKIARKFASATAQMGTIAKKKMKKEEPEKWREMVEAVNCIFLVKSSELGASIENLSAYKSEHEFVLGRKVKIMDVELFRWKQYGEDSPDEEKLISAKIICDEI